MSATTNPSRLRTAPCALLLLCCASACRAYRDPLDFGDVAAASRPTTRPGDVEVGPRFVDKKTTVRARGRFENGAFYADRVEVRDDDDEVELKGALESFDRAAGLGAVGGAPFRVDAKSEVVGEDGKTAVQDGAAKPGAWVKAECAVDGDALRLLKLSVRERKVGEEETLQGTVTQVRRGARRFLIGGVPLAYGGNTAFVFTKKDEPAPEPEARLIDPPQERRVRRFTQGDEDWRPDSGLAIGDALVVGGTLEFESEYRGNNDLREALRRDRLLYQAVAKLELSADLGRNAFAYGALRTTYDIVHFDQEANEPSGEDTSLEALFVKVLDVPWEGFSLQVGRQRFEEGREWVVRRDYDAARATQNFSFGEFELSVGEKLSDADLEDDGVVNWLAAARFELLPRQNLYAYLLHRRHGTFVDLDRKHFGFSGEGKIGAFYWWSDVGFVKGNEGGLPVEGKGFDVAAMYVFKDLPLEPSVYVGFAHGEGDGDLSDGVDNSFRQTGLQRNNDRFNGVAGFRYYGTLFRPELSNMEIWTAGVGVKPGAESSVDLLFHAYRQDVPFPLIRNSRLRYEPNGLDTDLGVGVDLVIGLEDWRPWEFEIDLGWFDPGAAFTDATDAWYVLFQAKYSF